MANDPSGDDPEDRRDPLGQRLQTALRAAFEKVAAEPLPQSLKALLARLRAAEKAEKKDPPPDIPHED